MNRAPAFSPVLQLAPLAAALAIAVAIYAALIGAWRKTARWLRGWWRSRHPVHAAPRQWHDEKFERVPADPRFHAAFGTPPWQDAEKPEHPAPTMVPLHGSDDAPSPNVPGDPELPGALDQQPRSGVSLAGQTPESGAPGALHPEIAKHLNDHGDVDSAVDSIVMRAVTP